MKKNKLTIKDSLIAFVCSFIICQLSVLIASIIILFIGAKMNISNIENFSKTCVGNLILTSVLYITMFLIFKTFNKNKENKIIQKPTFKKTLIYILLASTSFFALYPIVNSFDYLLSLVGFKSNQLAFDFSTANYFICFIPMVILPAICEELLFRGLIFKGLKKHGAVLSILLTTVFFTLYHMSLQQTIYPLLFGALLTFVMYKENNLIYTFLMHLTNNFLALTFMFLKINLFVNKLWYYILAAILLTIFITILICFIIKLTKQQNNSKIEKNSLLLLIIVLFVMFILWIVSNIYR